MTERRRPLGGVTKESYVHNGGHELTYDLLAGLKSDICQEIQQIKNNQDEIKASFITHVPDCEKKFVTITQAKIFGTFILVVLMTLGIKVSWPLIKSFLTIL